MTLKKIFFYLTLSLAMVIPVPGRFAFGLIILVLFNIQTAVCTLMIHAVRRIGLENLSNSLIAITLVAVTVLCKQILIFFCPLAALTLGLAIYLPALSSVVIEFFFLDKIDHLKPHILRNMGESAGLSLIVLFYFLLRDIFGYGTFTLPAHNRIIAFLLPFNPERIHAVSFIATIPGSYFMLAGIVTLTIFIYQKIRERKKSNFKKLKQKGGENV